MYFKVAATFLALAACQPVNGSGLRALTARITNPEKKQDEQLLTFHRIMMKNTDEEEDTEHRHLFYKGYSERGFRIKARRSSDGKWFCMDAAFGTSPDSDGQYPSVALRPCGYSKSQYFDSLFDPNLDGAPRISLETALQANRCLLVEDGKQSSAESGDRIRIGDCGDDRGNEFIWNGKINEYGELKVAGNADLCITFEGDNPDSDDRLYLRTCRDSTRFDWKLEVAYYYDLPDRSGDTNNCMRIRGDSTAKRGDRIVWDHCDDDEKAGQWRMDTNGLLHSRLDDEMCMEAEDDENGAAIRLEPCDSFESKQRFEFDGEDKPIYLKSKPYLYLQPQGNNNDTGDPVVLGRSARMVWSPDGINP